MSILVKGMEMPPVGTGKVIMIDSDGDVWTAGRDEYTIIDGAKVFPVPPHGRLIDADEFEVIGYQGVPKGYTDTFDDGALWLSEKIDAAPTIIPADRKEGEA